MVGYSSVSRPARNRHGEFEVLQRRALGDLPVDAGRHQGLILDISRGWHSREVELEVADVAQELILVDIPLLAVSSRDVDIRIYKPDAFEVTASLDNRTGSRVADELGVIQPGCG